MTLVILLIICAAIIGSTSMMGVLGFLFYRIRRIEGGGMTQFGAPELPDRVQLLEEQLMAAEAEIASFSERLDFTEKLLMSGDDRTPSAEVE